MEKTTKEVLPVTIDASDIEQGINKPEAWPLCIEIAKAYNERQKLIDSNKELLKALNTLHHFSVNNCRSYKSIHNSLHFETINLIANGLHTKFKSITLKTI